VTGAQSIVNTNAAIFNVTGVKLEIGSVATPFPRQSLAKSMADCQRYYSTGFFYALASQASGQSIIANANYPVAMRASPTITPTHSSISNASGFTIVQATGTSTISGFYEYANMTTTGTGQWLTNWIASAEL
jgi:hypothetical protein